jgi:hypothetical protein
MLIYYLTLAATLDVQHPVAKELPSTRNNSSHAMSFYVPVADSTSMVKITTFSNFCKDPGSRDQMNVLMMIVLSCKRAAHKT